MKHLKSLLTLGLILVSIIPLFILSTAYAEADIQSALLQEAEVQENLNTKIKAKDIRNLICRGFEVKLDLCF